MNRRWWDAAVLAIVAVAVVVGLAHGSGAAKPNPAPTGCVPTDFNGGVCVHGRLVWPTDGRGDLPGQSPAGLCAPGSDTSVLCDRNGKLATTDGPPPPSTPPAPRPRPASTPKPAPTYTTPAVVCQQPEDFGLTRDYLTSHGFCN